jgi:hypothetical protein
MSSENDINRQAKVANWAIESNEITQKTKKLHEPAYTQLYFPYNKDQINVTSLGRPTVDLQNGITVSGLQDISTCTLNAAKMHNERNAIAFGNENLATKGATYYANEKQYDDFANVDTSDFVEKVALYNPKKGSRNVQVKFVKPPAEGGIWLFDSDSKKPKQAYVHTTRSTYNNKPIIVFQNVPIKVTVRVKSPTSKEEMDVEFVNEKGEPIETEMFKIPQIQSTPVYFNYNNDKKTCTIYDKPLPEDMTYKNSIIKTVFSIPLKADTKTVKLDERGELKQYNDAGESASILYSDISMAYSIINPTVQKPGKYYVLSLENDGALNIFQQSNVKTIAKSSQNLNPGRPAEWKNEESYNGFITSEKKDMAIMIGKSLQSKNGAYRLAIEQSKDYLVLVFQSATKNPNSLYSILPDHKMGKLFLGDTNDVNMFTAFVPDEFTKRSDTTTQYANMYPGNKPDYDLKKGNCKELCKTSAKGCNHYYATSEGCYIPKTGITPYVFSNKPDNVKSSALNIVNRQATSGNMENDAKVLDTYVLNVNPYSKIGNNAYNLRMDPQPYAGVTDFKPYLPFHNDLTTTMEEKVFGEKSEPIVKNPMSVFYTSKKEGFALYDDTLNRIDNKIMPKANAYEANQAKVNTNKDNIENKRNSIDARYIKLGDEDELMYDLSNNVFYDFEGTEIYSLREDRSLVNALLNDQKAMLEEQDNLNIIGGLTVLTLAVAIIFGIKSME